MLHPELKERIARVLYYEDNKRVGVTDWVDLSDERRAPWRQDAHRVLDAIQLDHSINHNT